MTVEEIFDKIRRLRAYFGRDGGVTVSGGEPLMQATFVKELFRACKREGINCALDTSGCIYNREVEDLLSFCDLVLLDYKYMNGKDYENHVGCSLEKVEDFLSKLDEANKRVWIRQVIIPDINDRDDLVPKLRDLRKKYRCIEKIELLPFRKLCIEKYKEMGIDFPLADTPEADPDKVAEWQRLINE